MSVELGRKRHLSWQEALSQKSFKFDPEITAPRMVPTMAPCSGVVGFHAANMLQAESSIDPDWISVELQAAMCGVFKNALNVGFCSSF